MSGPLQFLFSENLIVYLQSLGNPFLDLLFLTITTIGSEPGFMLLSTMIFWCYGKKTGIRLMYVALLSAYTAIFAKSIFGMPRPPEYLHKIHEYGFGFPSGHAQVSSGFWGYLGGMSKKLWIIGVPAILAVSLSRVYLGVHYVGDVAGGILLGLLLAFVLLKTESGIAKKFNILGRRSKYFAALILPAILIITAYFRGGLLDQHIEIGLVMASVGAGYLMEEEYIRLEDAKNNKQRVGRASVGVLMLAVVYLVMGSFFPDFLTHVALGFTSTFIAPWGFAKMEDLGRRGGSSVCPSG